MSDDYWAKAAREARAAYNTRKEADEITRLRAENEKLREQLRGEIESHQAMTKAYENEIKMLKESREITRLRADLAAVTEERDALLARLAPVEDEALVEIATREIFIERRSLAAAIAAIRPHIEAAEREKWQKMLARMGAGTTKTGAVNE